MNQTYKVVLISEFGMFGYPQRCLVEFVLLTNDVSYCGGFEEFNNHLRLSRLVRIHKNFDSCPFPLQQMSVLLVKKKDLHGNTKVINLCLFSSSWFQFCIFIDKFSVKCFRHVTFFLLQVHCAQYLNIDLYFVIFRVILNTQWTNGVYTEHTVDQWGL